MQLSIYRSMNILNKSKDLAGFEGFSSFSYAEEEVAKSVLYGDLCVSLPPFPHFFQNLSIKK